MAQGMNKQDDSGHKSGQLTGKLIQLAYSQHMIEQKEREFEKLVSWVTNIDQRINFIMEQQSKAHVNSNHFNQSAFQNVNFRTIISSFMTLLDARCLKKDLHITGLTLLRKIIEIENKDVLNPAADWEGEDWEHCQKIIHAKQNNMVDIGCVQFLCKHIQDVEDDDILEETFLVCITLLLGGNIKSQDAFFYYF